MKKKQKYKLVIEYLPNYQVKYCFYNSKITGDEGGGWYSVIGHKLMCVASKYKCHNAIPVCNEEDLSEEYLLAYQKEKENYENSTIHKDRLQSFTQKLINHVEKL